MSIQKKSLISTLKTAKKANAATTTPEGEKKASMRMVSQKAISKKTVSMKKHNFKTTSLKAISNKKLVD